MVPSSSRSGHSPFKAVTPVQARCGSPAASCRRQFVTRMAAVFRLPLGNGQRIHTLHLIRYSSGSRGQSAKLLIGGSNPPRISSGESPLQGPFVYSVRTPASQAGNTGSSPVGITSQYGKLELSVSPFFSRYCKNLCDFVRIILILAHLFASIRNCSFI